MMPELEERYEDAVEGILHLLGRNAEIIAERERARRTAVALEQALVEAEEDVKTRDQELENWKRIYDASQSDNQEQRDRIAEYDDKLIAAELEADELRRALEGERKRAEIREEDLKALNGLVETVADLTLDHLGALVLVWIDGEFSITDRLQSIQFEKRHDLTVARVIFETAGTGHNTGGYPVDLHHPVHVLEPAREAVPF